MRSSSGQAAVVLVGLLIGALASDPLAGSQLDPILVGATGPEIGIIVTTPSDAANGDTSSYVNLIANPGPDGISLREALLVTNNDPGVYSIGFDAAMAGAEILVGTETSIDLPGLLGGGVTIDGDIDGDGDPDVEVAKAYEGTSSCGYANGGCGFRIASSGNELRDLSIRGFDSGVSLSPTTRDVSLDELPTNETYADNAVLGLIMKGIAVTGIELPIYVPFPGCEPFIGGAGGACETHNSFTDVELIGNTIRSAQYGIQVNLVQTIGDRLTDWTVTDNTIVVKGDRADNAIRFTAAGAHFVPSDVRMSDVLIARNTLRGSFFVGVEIESGAGATDENTIERLRIVDNLINNSACDRRICTEGAGVSLFLGECSAMTEADFDPLRYADGNVLQDVEISANTVLGDFDDGVVAGVGYCGSSNNRIRRLQIEQNTIRLIGAGSGISLQSGSGGPTRADDTIYTTANQIVDVSIEDNDITIRRNRARVPDATFQAGGIVLVGGVDSARDGLIKDVAIRDNSIDTWFIGINLLGGTYSPDERPTRDNSILDVRILDNMILNAPPTVRRVIGEEVSGVSLIGGYNGARDNRIACVVLRGNAVAGVRDDVSVIANAKVGGRPAPGNTVTLACPS